MVLASANGTFSFSVSVAHMSGDVDRSVKYIANRAAKNMISLESHTIVPTDTMFGRFRAGCAWGLGAWVALVTLPLWLVKP
ncbi:hypothetical protein GCM10011512_07410 [Tersicoccus solisilvae]|uniref:Uncharacterized protein n=1 Tax=Tersicoccus solisilvae TaxID=1882339 RepID=A0ABQ1NQW1_9MICC|nr:hypothetical protein GCM10011512_07410 [Tersicoccus solisilvae]